MNISVLIPWDTRTDCTWRKIHFNWLKRRWQELLWPVDICIGKNYDEPFNRSKARNNAFKQSCGDYLVVADADALFDAAQINLAVQTVKNMDTWCLPFGPYYNLTRETTKGVLGGVHWRENALKPTRELGLPPAEYEHLVPDSPGGIRVLTKEMWEAIGGFDDRFIGWGYEDDAFRVALDVMVGKAVRLQGCDLYHMWHPVSPTDGFESPNIQHNRLLYRKYQRAKSPAMMRKVLP